MSLPWRASEEKVCLAERTHLLDPRSSASNSSPTLLLHCGGGSVRSGCGGFWRCSCWG